jgi:hypothetical protein
MDRGTEQHRARFTQSDLGAVFYDNMVRERSPYTGILAPSKIDSLSPWDSPSGDDETYAAPGSGPTIRRVHVIAALLVGVFSGAVALAALIGHGQASAAPDEKPTVQSAAMAPSIGADAWTQSGKSSPRPALAPATPRPPEGAVPAAKPTTPQPSVTPSPLPAETSEPQVPTEEAGATEKDGRAIYDELLAKAKKGALKTRIQNLRDAIAAYPEGDEAMARLAIILMERVKDRDEALALATRAAELNANNAMAWLAVGYIHQMNGQPKESREAYIKCSKAEGPKKFVRDCSSLL